MLLGHPSEPNASVRRDAILVVIGDGSLVGTSTLSRRDDTFAPEGLRTSNPSLGFAARAACGGEQSWIFKGIH